MHKTWVSPDRLLPAHSALHVGAQSHSAPAEGCLISGQVMVKRVPGLLLVRVDGKRHSFNLKASNLTHVVHHLSFGHSDDRMNQNARRLLPSLQGLLPTQVTRGIVPLDGSVFTSIGKHESHEHFLKARRRARPPPPLRRRQG